MKQSINHSGFDSSALLTEVVSNLVAGAVTGVASVRRFFIRVIIIVVIVVAPLFFIAGMWFRDYVPGYAPPPAQTRPEERPRQPPPNQPDETEEYQRLIRKDPL
jgi:hypothetical protein